MLAPYKHLQRATIVGRAGRVGGDMSPSGAVSAARRAVPGRGRIGLADASALNEQLGRLTLLLERSGAGLAGPRSETGPRAAYPLLSCLVTEGPHRLGALADAVRSDPSTVSRHLAHLVADGLVQRRPDPVDGRAARWTATAEGRAVFEEHRRARTEVTRAALARWPVRDVRRLTALLHRLNDDVASYRCDHADGPALAADRTGCRA